MRALLILAALALTACAGDRYRLDEKWAPLRYVQEGGPLPVGLGNEGARTVGDTVHVRDLEAFRSALPGPLLDAVLTHEQVHAQRQEAAGVLTWIARYLTDRGFALEEEQLGWEAQIRYLRRHGHVVDLRAVARALSRYYGPWGRLVSEEEALRWAEGVK